MDTSSPQDHINQATMRKTDQVGMPPNVNLGGADSPWPVSRPASPNIGKTTSTMPTPANMPLSAGLPMSFWGGDSLQNNPAQLQSTAFQPVPGDYRNFGDVPVPGYSTSFAPENMQQGTQGGNAAFSGDASSLNYLQLANQNLGGQPAFSPHSDSMVLPMEAYTNLLDDTTLDFWTALTNSQDWGAPGDTQMGGTIFPGF